MSCGQAGNGLLERCRRFVLLYFLHPINQQCRSKPDSDAALTSKSNQRRMPWCNRKMFQKYRNGSEELRSKNAVCAADVCSKDMRMCRNRMRREANKGRLNIPLKK
jgi:hypothetical protein